VKEYEGLFVIIS